MLLHFCENDYILLLMIIAIATEQQRRFKIAMEHLETAQMYARKRNR
jgi:hypothetical protein